MGANYRAIPIFCRRPAIKTQFQSGDAFPRIHSAQAEGKKTARDKLLQANQ